jgi:hypothetical protein
MFRRLITVAAWALLAFIAYATISPIQAMPTLFASPGFERFAAFMVLGALFCLSYPRHIGLVCLIVLGSSDAARAKPSLCCCINATALTIGRRAPAPVVCLAGIEGGQ